MLFWTSKSNNFSRSSGKHPEISDSNVYDTLAWCAFNKFKSHDGTTSKSASAAAQNWLKLAHGYLEKLDGKSNNATSPLMSMAIQHDHLQEIMAACDTEIRGSSIRKVDL